MSELFATPVRWFQSVVWRVRRFWAHRRVQQIRSGGSVVIAAAVCALVLVSLGAIPVRNYVTQRDALDEANAELSRIQAEVDSTRLELDRLQTDAEIERQARANYDLVYPGEESFRILPAAPGE